MELVRIEVRPIAVDDAGRTGTGRHIGSLCDRNLLAIERARRDLLDLQPVELGLDLQPICISGGSLVPRREASIGQTRLDSCRSTHAGTPGSRISLSRRLCDWSQVNATGCCRANSCEHLDELFGWNPVSIRPAFVGDEPLQKRHHHSLGVLSRIVEPLPGWNRHDHEGLVHVPTHGEVPMNADRADAGSLCSGAANAPFGRSGM